MATRPDDEESLSKEDLPADVLDLSAEVPQSGPVVVDLSGEAPRSGGRGLYGTVVPTHDQETRKQIALLILGLIALYHGASLGFFLFERIDTAQFNAAIAAMSGIQALAAAAVGFYYGSK